MLNYKGKEDKEIIQIIDKIEESIFFMYKYHEFFQQDEEKKIVTSKHNIANYQGINHQLIL